MSTCSARSPIPIVPVATTWLFISTSVLYPARPDSLTLAFPLPHFLGLFFPLLLPGQCKLNGNANLILSSNTSAREAACHTYL